MQSAGFIRARSDRAGSLAVTTGNWAIRIGGAPAEEWFAELPYAG